VTIQQVASISLGLEGLSHAGSRLPEGPARILWRLTQRPSPSRSGDPDGPVYLNSPAVKAEHGDEAPDFSNTNSSTYPGYHLPHVWLAADGQSPKVSILDLAAHGKFCVFTGIGGSQCLQAAQKITSKGGIQIHGYSIGYCCDYVDAYRDWINVRGVDKDGVVLVRPDHFVCLAKSVHVH
jgi:Aromatic-ring hydroxylase, C-terminal